jgi:hypothetical protein
MPNVTITPVQLKWAGAAVETMPARIDVTPAPLRWLGGAIGAGPGLGRPVIITTPKLDRLQRTDLIVTQGRTPEQQFQLRWQRTMEAIEQAFFGLTGQVGDLATIIAGIQAAQSLAQAANDAATEAKAQQDITNSYTNPSTVLTADASGTITISAHQRVYGDGRTVPVDGGSVGGFPAGAYVSVYYDDAARAGGAVMYQGTASAIAQAGNRHSVGQIAIPAAGEPPAQGGGVSAPGYTPAGETPRQYEDYR